jgi:PAS domain S-box-containing protein
MTGVKQIPTRELSSPEDLKSEIQFLRNKVRLLEDKLASSMFIIDECGQIVDFNANTLSLLGCSYDELYGSKIFDLFSDKSDLEIQNMLSVFGTGNLSGLICEIQTETSGTVQLEINSGITQDNGRRFYLGVLRRLKDGGSTGEPGRKSDWELDSGILNLNSQDWNCHNQLLNQNPGSMESDDPSEKSRLNFRQWVEVAPVGIFTVEENRVTYANESFARLLGYGNRCELGGMEVGCLLSKKSVRLVEGIFGRNAKTNDRADYYEVEFANKKASTRSGILWPINLEDTGARSTLCFVTDTTHNILLRDGLAKSQKLEAIGSLAAGIAHDFNNVLTAIMGYSQLAFDKAPKGSSLSSYLKHVMDASDRASDLVSHILSFSRETAEGKKPVLVGPILKETMRFLRASVPMTIEFKQDISSDLRPVMGVATQIHQVIMNLCTNATHAMKLNGGTLGVSLSEVVIEKGDLNVETDVTAGDYLKLTVSDTGHGMSPELASRIFDPYFTTKSKDEGTGLGLSIVNGIVRDHGGFIRLKSRENEGTTFEIYLPVCPKSGEPQVFEESLVRHGQGRIMVVDDEPDIVTMLPQMLRNLGYEAVARRRPEEALELFSEDPFKFDLVITDMTMPRMTGLQLSEALHKIRNDIPVILMTGFSDALDEKTVEDFGIDELIYKPVRKTVLAHIILGILNGK